MEAASSIAFEAINPSEVAKAATIFDDLKQLRLKLKSADEAVLERAFETHAQSVLDKLDARLQQRLNPSLQMVEVILARYGLYDAAFQQVALLSQAISPTLGDSVKELKGVYSGFLSDFYQIVNQLVEENSHLSEEMGVRTGQAGELQDSCVKLDQTLRRLNEEAEEQNRKILDLRQQLRVTTQELNRLRETPQSAATSTGAVSKRPPFDSSVAITNRPKSPGPNNYGDGGAASSPRHSMRRVNSNSSLNLSLGASMRSDTGTLKSSVALNTPSRGPLSFVAPVNWLQSFREDIQAALDSGRCRLMTINECREGIEKVYESKRIANEKSAQGVGNLPMETMEQHLYRTYEKKYGLRKLAAEHAGTLLRAVDEFAGEDMEICVFRKVVRNEVEEDFRLVQKELVSSIRDLTLVQLMGRFPAKDTVTINSMLEQKMNTGIVYEDEWRDMVNYLYNANDSSTLCMLLRKQAQLMRDQDNEIPAFTATSMSSSGPMSPQTPTASVILNRSSLPTKISGAVSVRLPPSSPDSASQTPKSAMSASFVLGVPTVARHSTDQTGSGVIGYDRGSSKDVKRLGYASPSLKIGVKDPGVKSRKDMLKLPFQVFLKIVQEFQLRAHEEFLSVCLHVFRQYDQDVDGVLTAGEFRGFYNDLRRAIPALGRYDSEEDELRNLLTMMNKLDPHETDRITFSSSVACLQRSAGTNQDAKRGKSLAFHRIQVSTMSENLVPSFQQIPYSTLVKRIDSGSSGIQELSNLLHERREIHERTILFELKMSKANIFKNEIETSTSERLLGFFKNLFIFVSKTHIKAHKDFNDSAMKELDELKTMRAAAVHKIKQTVQHGLKEVGQAEEALDKAKKGFAKAKADFERSVEKLKNMERALVEHQRAMEEKKREGSQKEKQFSMGRMFQSAFESNPEQDRDKQQRKMERRSDELVVAANVVVDRKKHLLKCLAIVDTHLQTAAAAFQELELERMRKLRSTMKKYCETERALLKAKEEQIAFLEEAITLHDPEEDSLLYITQEKHTEITHKYGNALTLLDEYLFRTKEGGEWSFTTFDEYTVPAESGRSAGSASQEESAPVAAAAASTDASEERGGITPTPAETSSDTQTADVPAAVPEEVREDPRLGSLGRALDGIFPAEEVEPAAELQDVEWMDIFSCKPAQDVFLQRLDDKRGTSARMTSVTYRSLAAAMKALLSFCAENDDSMSAMRVLNMANTFYMRDEIGTEKCYLQADDSLKNHPIWRKQGFWEAALKESLFSEMEKLKPSAWDELSPELLRETVVSIHNLVFGQLGTLSFTMREQGNVDGDVVAANVLTLCRKFQLCEDQEFELMSSITGQHIREYSPPPMIANVPVSMTEASVHAVPHSPLNSDGDIHTSSALRERTESHSSSQDGNASQPQSRRTSRVAVPVQPEHAAAIAVTVVQSSPASGATTPPPSSSVPITHTAHVVTATVTKPAPTQRFSFLQSRSTEQAAAPAAAATPQHKAGRKPSHDDDFFAVL